MEPMYLLSEPVFQLESLDLGREKLMAPVGQAELCLEVLRSVPVGKVAECLREEYLAIAYSLVAMGVDFRIIYCHEDRIDKKTIGICAQLLGCRFVRFSADFFPPFVLFLRDFSVTLGKVVLLNSEVIQPFTGDGKGMKVLYSPFGEGGRIWATGQTMLISERIIPGMPNYVMPPHMVAANEYAQIVEAGIRVGLVPPPVGTYFNASGLTNRVYCFDHLDRVGALLSGPYGIGLHLVVDPALVMGDWINPPPGLPWAPLAGTKLLERLRSVCDPLGVRLHVPEEPLKVPYALNLVQFYDGRVLMTGGDEPLAAFIKDILGDENVYTTPIPIRCFPTWEFAGIHCLVGEAPMPVLKKIPQ